MTAAMNGALNGIKVLDLSRILAGPWASQMLADLGAEVIKVEKPGSGDDTRHWGPPYIKADQAAYFHCANRNKQSLALDISTAEGQNIIKALAQQADVLLENYKVGGLTKYGLDYASLSALNPRLVYCSITGFGQTGPSAEQAGYDAMIQGEAGLMSITGEPDGEPMKVGVAVVDIMTGLYSCNAILAALLARGLNGRGQHIDMALFDVQVAALANQGMNYLSTGENPPRLGNAHPNIVPYQVFATQDGAIILAVGNDQQFRAFCQLAGQAELAADPRFQSNAGRVQHRKVLIPTIAALLAKRNSAWWLSKLADIAVPCGPVNNLEQVFHHPQTLHRQLLQQVPDQQGQLLNTIANPIRLSETPVQYHHAAPDLGQHSEQILRRKLNYSDEQIQRLRTLGIID